MKKNIGTYDRLARLFLGIWFILYGVYSKSGLTTLAGVFSIYEALASWCLFYQLIGRNTCPLAARSESQIQLLPIYLQGIAVLGVAIVLNLFASLLNWETWYTFLQHPKSLSLDNLIFLFVVYPFVLGLVAKYARDIRLKRSQERSKTVA